MRHQNEFEKCPLSTREAAVLSLGNRCIACGGTAFDPLCEGLDRLHHIDGSFTFWRCRQCELIRVHPSLMGGRAMSRVAIASRTRSVEPVVRRLLARLAAWPVCAFRN